MANDLRPTSMSLEATLRLFELYIMNILVVFSIFEASSTGFSVVLLFLL